MSKDFPHITLRVKSEECDGNPVPADAFLTAFRSLRTITSEIDNALDVDKKEREWLVTGLEYGSAVLTISPSTRDMQDATRRVSTVYDGVRYVQNVKEEKAKRPNAFSDKALTALKMLGAISMQYNDKVCVFVENTITAVEVNTHTVANVDDWLGKKREFIATVEGDLLAVTLHRKLKFTVYDKSGHNIECYFPDTMMDQVKRALGNRVAIRGRVSYRADGVPVAVKATTIKEFLPEGKLPTVDDMVGIWNLPMTGDQYVRSLRDG